MTKDLELLLKGFRVMNTLSDPDYLERLIKESEQKAVESARACSNGDGVKKTFQTSLIDEEEPPADIIPLLEYWMEKGKISEDDLVLAKVAVRRNDDYFLDSAFFGEGQ